MSNSLSSSDGTAQDRLDCIVGRIGGDVPKDVLEQIAGSWTRLREYGASDAFNWEEALGGHPFLFTVVIPVYNEQATVAQVVTRVAAIPVYCQIIIVDDGSTDGTSEILESVADVDGVEIVIQETNRGKGAALRAGFSKAQGKYIVVQDADLEYHPRDIAALIEPLLRDEADVVYGSRWLSEQQQSQGRLHRLGNRWLTMTSNLFTGLKLTDMETCYKAMKIELLDGIEICQNRFGVEPELTAKLARRGARFVEVPISYHGRSFSEGKKVGMKDLFNAIWCIVRYRRSD